MLNSQTTGAGNDIERSTEIARKMVCEWGMSDNLGPLAFGKKEEQIFLGREFAQHRDYSEDTARLIDDEIRAIVTQSYERAKEIILRRTWPSSINWPIPFSKKKFSTGTKSMPL